MSIRRTAQLLTVGLLGTLACSRDQPGSRDQPAAPAAAPTDGTTPAPRAAAAAPPAPTATATPVAPVAPATITLAAPAAPVAARRWRSGVRSTVHRSASIRPWSPSTTPST